MKHNRGFSIILTMAYLTFIGVIVTISAFGSKHIINNQFHAAAMAANGDLAKIYVAKALLVRTMAINPVTIKPGPVIRITEDDLSQYLDGLVISRGAHDGGTYAVGRLTDASGEIVIPTCSSEHEDPDGDGITNGEDGYFIFRPSFVKFKFVNDPERGLYRRGEQFTFADDPNGL